MRTYSFSIPLKLPGLNEYTAACRSNAFVGAKMKKDAEEQIRWCIRSQLGAAVKAKHLPPKVPVKVYFKWQEGSKHPRDKDNIAMAKKFILDAMVAEDVIINDGWDYIDSFEDSFCRGHGYSVVVDIAVLDKL